MSAMLPDFVTALEPYWEAKGEQPFATYIHSRKDEVSDALLSVTDSRAKRPKHAPLAKVYNSLRPKAKDQVEEALPRLGSTVEALAT
ncbi:MAG: hypothetical protein CSB46_08300 [Micrococcales bacterium]|nr:MAG: hypothetical protein CSB46_08300 [Micrococcales bacterium]